MNSFVTLNLFIRLVKYDNCFSNDGRN